MMRGLSRGQLALIAVYLLGLLVTFAAVLLGLWQVAAAAAVVSFGLFSGWIVLTLAAMSRAASRTRRRVDSVHREVRGVRAVALLRRIEGRLAWLNRAMDRVEDRTEASEQRLTAGFENHRLQVEDEIARVAGRDPQH